MSITNKLSLNKIYIKSGNGNDTYVDKLTPELLKRVGVEDISLYWKSDDSLLWILSIGSVGQYSVMTVYDSNSRGKSDRNMRVFKSTEKGAVEVFCKENKIFGY